MKKITFVTAFLLFIISWAFGQSTKTLKADTIYYVLNIDATPINDRIITADTSKPHVFYKINCPCLKNELPPVFRSNDNKKIKISAEDLKLLKPVKLVDFIQLVKQNDDEKEFYRNLLFIFWRNEVIVTIKTVLFFLDQIL